MTNRSVRVTNRWALDGLVMSPARGKVLDLDVNCHFAGRSHVSLRR